MAIINVPQIPKLKKTLFQSNWERDVKNDNTSDLWIYFIANTKANNPRAKGTKTKVKNKLVPSISAILDCVNPPKALLSKAESNNAMTKGICPIPTYSKFLPETEDHASYFSFYDVTEKIGIVVGTFFFGYIEEVTGSIRMSVISITIFFILGFLLLFFIPKQEKLKMSDD